MKSQGVQEALHGVHAHQDAKCYGEEAKEGQKKLHKIKSSINKTYEDRAANCVLNMETLTVFDKD